MIRALKAIAIVVGFTIGSFLGSILVSFAGMWFLTLFHIEPENGILMMLFVSLVTLVGLLAGIRVAMNTKRRFR